MTVTNLGGKKQVLKLTINWVLSGEEEKEFMRKHFDSLFVDNLLELVYFFNISSRFSAPFPREWLPWQPIYIDELVLKELLPSSFFCQLM